MQTVDSSAAKDQDALQAAINTSKDAAYVRGVKRLCVATDDVTETNNEGLSLFKTPFLETKWDSEASRKRREYSCAAQLQSHFPMGKKKLLMALCRQITRVFL